MSGIRLVTRADDAGLSRTTDKAVRASVRQGIARNISLLAPAPLIEDAAELLLDLSKTADFGLHVCLTSEWANLRWGAVAPSAPGLMRDDGSFAETTDELVSMSPDLDGIMTEVEAQLERLTGFGFTLSYLDTHMDILRFPGLAAKLSEFAEKHGLVNNGALLESGALQRLPGWPGPGEHPGTELADHLSTTAPGTYLLVGHPAFKTEETERLRLPGGKRGGELLPRNRQRRMFSDIEIVDYCENVGIELLRYSDLK